MTAQGREETVVGVARHLVSPIGAEWPLLRVQRLVASQNDERQVSAAAVVGLQNLTGCSQPTGDLRISLLGFAPLSARGSRRPNSWSTQNRWHSATKPAAAELTVNDGAQTTPQATPKPALKQPSAKRPPPCMRDTGIQSASHCAFRTPQRRWTSVAGGERQKRDRTLKVGWMQPQFADTPRQPAPHLSIKINALPASCSRQEFKTQ